MAIEGFNYEEFAQTLSSQASELVPANFQEFQRNYIVNTVKNFALLSAEAIYNDDKANFNAEQAMLITQIIAEWSFHKSVDVIKSGIMPDYWDGIMQKIAFTIFEIAKQTISKNLPQDEVLRIVEHHVKKTYEKVLGELKDRKMIDQNTYEQAAKQSNIDEMMHEIQEERVREEEEHPHQHKSKSESGQNDSKILKLASVALLLKQIPQNRVNVILNKFDPKDAQAIVQYMETPDLETKMDESIAIKCLHEIRLNLPEPKFINPNKLMSKMGKILEHIPKEKIEQVVIKERPNIKEFISKSYDGELSPIPSKVANIIVQHLEENSL